MEIDERKLPRLPKTGGCICGANYFYVRGQHVGDSGHFWCKRCGRRYRFWDEEPWNPGANPPSPTR